MGKKMVEQLVSSITIKAMRRTKGESEGVGEGGRKMTACIVINIQACSIGHVIPT
jgi:hypothetical protein